MGRTARDRCGLSSLDETIAAVAVAVDAVLLLQFLDAPEIALRFKRTLSY
jgi:hypothetical protein